MRVLFFAHLKDATKCGSIELAPPSPPTAGQLWVELLKKFPALEEHKKNIRLARNWEYADEQTIFSDADEVALIPPVSGG